MKEFATYTLLRLVYLVVTYVIVLGVWMLVTDREGLIQLEPLVIAFLVSGIASYLLLDRQREAFAQRVDARARRASDNFSKMKAREDED
ncbi:DUF4229 domain-containing protein [Nocardioides alkalitolerans]|uniref:DUF4229 domain-containing protein n=1 Tax=Nocardioides alkalitolerans TaxID=281714 RepID=UPI000401602C|nr:DUF4229 domain-containing protein [Nocardioides alkalitolerans]